MSTFQLLPSQLMLFNEQMLNALTQRGEIDLWSADCEQFLFNIFRETYGTSDINAVLNNPAVFSWLVDQAVAHRRLAFVKPIQIQTVEKVVEKEVFREVEKPIREYPASRVTSNQDVREGARKSIEALQSAEAERKLVEREVEMYQKLRDDTLYLTGGNGSHSANAYVRAQAKIKLDEYVKYYMHDATKKVLGL